MKTGGIQRNPVMRWFEPQHTVLGGDQYFTHAWGSLYVLSNRAALALASIITALPTGLRFFNNEGGIPIVAGIELVLLWPPAYQQPNLPFH